VWEPANDLEAQRLDKLNRLQEAGIEAYPPRVKRTHTIIQAIDSFTAAESKAAEGDEVEEVPVVVCGRIVANRPMGRVTFTDIEDGSGRVQVMLRENQVGKDFMKVYASLFDLFDFIEVTGTMLRTRTGEVTVNATDIRLLSKAISPLPVIKERELEDGTVEYYGGFSDPDSRYRERYADLAVNTDVREIFRSRSKTINAIRRFLDDEGFLEVETPILQPLYGGAAARPFITHHNKMHRDMYLRISFELYLKRLLVGMYDAVYEIGRDFRNEGISKKHNPEFTQVEFYKAYIDYEEVMNLTERMVAFAAEQVTGDTTIVYQGHTVDLSPPWKRITLRDAIREVVGIDYLDYPEADQLAAAVREKGYGKGEDGEDTTQHRVWGELVNDLLDIVEPTLIQPTFIIDYPIDISPLAKKKPGDERHVERFEFFIAGLEMGNAFTELNDPLDQEERFVEMGRMYGSDSDEFHPVDEDYLQAMRYGMPPNGGFGMGVDRLVMLLTDQPNIREVLLFPALRERSD